MLLVVAWDGACFDIVDPLAGRGRLPAIARLLAEGARREVASTVPAITFPAWTTFATAASPALHGVTDFSVRSGYRLRFLNSTYRALPALWNVVSERGGTAGVYALPATYPPDAFRGVMMCGFDTPLGAAKLGRRSHPAGFAGEVEARYGATGVGGPAQVRIDAAWHERALERMLRTIEQRTQICVDLLRERSFDCFFVHYAESDTVAHQFWHLCDERSPRFAAGAAHDAIERVYEALDASLARLREAAGADADVMVISDHGSGGASDRAIFWNAWLAERGYLHFVERPLAARAAGAARRAVLRLVPPALQSTLLAAAPAAAARLESGTRLGGIDWSRTRVFSEELNYFPSLWLNLRGREPEGTVGPDEVERVVAALTDDLRAFRDPFDGAPVVARVVRREEVACGPFAERLPDVILELREPGGYSYAGLGSRAGAERAPIRRLTDAERSGARGTSMPGAHRRNGLCALGGPGVRPGRYRAGTLADAGATAMLLCGCAPHPDADGRPWNDCLAMAVPVRTARENGADAHVAPRVSTREEEHEIAERLRALGYLA